MSHGNGQLLLYVISIIAVGNCVWSIVNWDKLRQARKLLSLATRIRMEALADATAIRQKAVDDVLAFRSAEFKVCGACGRIVQGVCLDCLAAVKE